MNVTSMDDEWTVIIYDIHSKCRNAGEIVHVQLSHSSSNPASLQILNNA